MIQPETFERALHSWDKWLDSIRMGRQELGHHPPLPEMKAAAEKALSELGFPPCAIFALYWLCCVFSNYQTSKKAFAFDRIVVPSWFPLPFGLWEESHIRRRGENFYEPISFRGKRIYPPQLWTQHDLKFWGLNHMGYTKISLSVEGKLEEKTMGAPNSPRIISDFEIALPDKHPVLAFITRGRPLKKQGDETLL